MCSSVQLNKLKSELRHHHVIEINDDVTKELIHNVFESITLQATQSTSNWIDVQSATIFNEQNVQFNYTKISVIQKTFCPL